MALAIYYVAVWLMTGRRPQQRSVVVRYDPPPALTPTAVRYLFIMGCDGRTFAAVLAQLAAHRIISITPDHPEGVVYLTKLESDRQVLKRFSAEEQLVLQNVLRWQESGVALSRPDPNLMEKIEKLIQLAVGKYVTRNLPCIAWAVVAPAAAAMWMSLSQQQFGDDPLERSVMASFTGLTVGTFIAASVCVSNQNLQAVKLAIKGLYHRRVLFVLVLLILLYPAMWYLLMRAGDTHIRERDRAADFSEYVGSTGAPGLNHRRETALERNSRLSTFLQHVEQDRLRRLNPTDQALQAEQESLPFAIALDVREGWGDERSWSRPRSDDRALRLRLSSSSSSMIAFGFAFSSCLWLFPIFSVPVLRVLVLVAAPSRCGRFVICPTRKLQS